MRHCFDYSHPYFRSQLLRTPDRTYKYSNVSSDCRNFLRVNQRAATLFTVETILGRNLRRYRLKSGYTLSRLSHESGIKVPTLSAMERGRIRTPSYDSISKVAQALKIPKELLLEDPAFFPLCEKSDLKGALTLDFKKEGFSLISYSSALEDIFIGKCVLKPKRELRFGNFPRLRLLFLQVIFGKLELRWNSHTVLIGEGENMTLSAPLERTLVNPLAVRDASFLLISLPSLISANLGNRKLSA